MIGWMRIGLGVLSVAAGSAILAPLQALALKVRFTNEFRLPRAWHRLILRALGIRVSIHGAMSSQRPLLLASNHVSWTDVMVLGSSNDLAFIAKSEMAGWPILGSLARLQRTVFIERERRRKSGEQASEIAARLAAGDAMVLFAEGTTSDGNLLLPFKSTLFGAASIAIADGGIEKVFIQPVAIAYTRLHGLPMGRQHRTVAAWIGDMDLVPHIGRLLAEGAVDVEVHFGEPLEFHAGSSRKELARRAEEQVHAMMQNALRGRPGARQERN